MKNISFEASTTKNTVLRSFLKIYSFLEPVLGFDALPVDTAPRRSADFVQAQVDPLVPFLYLKDLTFRKRCK